MSKGKRILQPPDDFHIRTVFPKWITGNQGSKLWDQRYGPRIREYFKVEKDLKKRWRFMVKQRKFFYRCLLGSSWKQRLLLTEELEQYATARHAAALSNQHH